MLKHAYDLGVTEAFRGVGLRKLAGSLIPFKGPTSSSAGQAAEAAPGFLGKAFRKVKDFFGNPMVENPASFQPHQFVRKMGPDKFQDVGGTGGRNFREHAENAILKKLQNDESVTAIPSRFAPQGFTLSKSHDLFQSRMSGEKRPSSFMGIMGPSPEVLSHQVYVDEMDKFIRAYQGSSGAAAVKKVPKVDDPTGIVAKLLSQNLDKRARQRLHPDNLTHNTNYTPQEKDAIGKAFSAGLFNVSSKGHGNSGPYGDAFERLKAMQAEKSVSRDRLKAQAKANQSSPEWRMGSKNTNPKGEYSHDKYEQLVDKLEKGVRYKRYGRNTAIGAAGVGVPAYALSGDDEPKKRRRS